MLPLYEEELGGPVGGLHQQEGPDYLLDADLGRLVVFALGVLGIEAEVVLRPLSAECDERMMSGGDARALSRLLHIAKGRESKGHLLEPRQLQVDLLIRPLALQRTEVLDPSGTLHDRPLDCVQRRPLFV